MQLTTALLFGFVTILFMGCKPSAEPTVYTVPKEEPEATVPGPAAPPMAGDMANSNFAPTTAGGLGHEPTWDVPGHWVVSSGSAMRKASYSVTHPEGTLDIAVTAFPGDVGGPLANVNRWRRQIGLGPSTQADLATNYAPLGGKEEGFLTDITGTEQATLAATFVHDGNSWFFKLTGPAPAVAKEREAFLECVRSVYFPGH